MIYLSDILTVYGVDETFLYYINSHLLNQKQRVRINIYSEFLNVISGAAGSQGSIVGPILFVSLMTFFKLLQLPMPTILQ